MFERPKAYYRSSIFILRKPVIIELENRKLQPKFLLLNDLLELTQQKFQLKMQLRVSMPTDTLDIIILNSAHGMLDTFGRIDKKTDEYNQKAIALLLNYGIQTYKEPAKTSLWSNTVITITFSKLNEINNHLRQLSNIDLSTEPPRVYARPKKD